ncbi:MAG: quinolinate synthase NadA [Candidatus Poseidoniaceae archaeon]|nr:quinolinate synthase NadA [Candidatus Poseidoniaceae archaeon]
MTLSLPMCDIDGQTLDLSEEELHQRIDAIKKRLGKDLLILGHHYQRDSIVQHADLLGDSFLLSKLASESEASNIVFCGVHFMAESADILSRESQRVSLPNLRAGCSMADMANLEQVEDCWEELIAESGLVDPKNRIDQSAPAKDGEACLVPVTYMNSSAELKAFVGEHGGVVCTSSNAAGVMDWAFERAGAEGKVLFFPDQHLGRNTGLAMGIPEEKMMLWNPSESPDTEILNEARIILWHGYCSVHRRFNTSQIEELRESEPDALVVVHPECRREVVDAADAVGSTEFIRRYVAEAPSGSTIGVGTEINMVKRLDADHPDKKVQCLDPLVCPCSTMYMIHPSYLLDVLQRIESGEEANRIVVPVETAASAHIALSRMLSIIN